MDFKKATLKKHINLAHNVFQLNFETEDTSFEFKAGQFVTIKIPQPANTPLVMRSYSISSKPTSGHFELCIKLIEDGKGSTYLNELKEGSAVEFLGPLGHFTFKTPPEKKTLLIGTGTGLAPLKSILEDELSKENTQPFHLLFGVRHEKDLFYREELAQLAEKHPNFTYTETLSRPESEEWTSEGGQQGRVTAHLEKISTEDLKNTEAYICGLKDMVLEVTEILQQKGLPKETVYFERFN